MRIVLVRHGEILANVINGEGTVLYTGALNNELTTLTELGKKQASDLAEKEIIKSIEKVYSSDLIRTIQTAELAKPGYILNLSKDLRERTLGEFEGRKLEDLQSSEEYNKYFTDERFKNFRTSFINKAPNGESYTDVSARCKRFLDSLDFSQDITIGIFSHFHTIRCLLLNLLKIEPKEKIFDIKISHCTPYIIEGNNIEEMKLVSHDLSKILSKNNKKN